MRQVNEDGSILVLAFTMANTSLALLKQLGNGRQAVKDGAQYAAARIVAGTLAR
jgi:hypothetical protein